MSNTTTSRRAVIVTALGLEYTAVRAHLQDFRQEENAGTVYGIGTFTTPLYKWKVCITENGAGNEQAALSAQSAINYFKPDVALFVGVAGGLKEKELALGDVVCATKVYGYEFGKDTKEGFKIRSEIGNSSFRMVSRARAEAHNNDWQERILLPLPGFSPKVYIAPIAAGNKVVGAARIYEFLRDNFSDAVAVEMESFGFLLALHRKPEIDTLIIRGISDLIYDKTAEQDGKWQPIAASNASAFAFEMLAKLPFKNQEMPQPSDDPIQKVPLAQSPKENLPVSLPSSNESVQIFYSYVSEDQSFVKQIDIHLSVLKHRKWVVTSYAGEAGADRMELLNRADIILLLISPYFIDQFDIYEKEVKRAMERRNEGIRVIPVLLRPTEGWHLEEFGGLQAVPRDKAVSLHSDRDRDSVFSTIAGEIRTIVTNIRKERGLSS